VPGDAAKERAPRFVFSPDGRMLAVASSGGAVGASFEAVTVSAKSHPAAGESPLDRVISHRYRLDG